MQVRKMLHCFLKVRNLRDLSSSSLNKHQMIAAAQAMTFIYSSTERETSGLKSMIFCSQGCWPKAFIGPQHQPRPVDRALKHQRLGIQNMSTSPKYLDMTSIRPTKQLLHTLSPFRPLTKRFLIRQWRPRPSHFSTTTPKLPYKPRSKLRPLIWALTFGITGFVIGKSMTMAVTLFDNIERDSDEDIILLEAILRAADDVPVVEKMLKHEGEPDAEWNEVPILVQEGDVIVNETLRGSMGLITPRAFWNEREKELIMVVYYGGALCGWPGIAHGGCTATVLLEGMGRALNCLTGGQQSIRPPEPSQLGLTYLKPVHAGNFYLLKARLEPKDEQPQPEADISTDKDLAKKLHRERGGIMARLNEKYDIDCTLEDLKGTKCMKAKGVWDVL
jgi:hypothetical protein